MTVRQAYEYILIELNKVKSPSIHLEDYLYYLNKGIQELTNERYRLYATSQQLTDDLAALSRSVTVTIANDIATIADSVTGAVIETVPVLLSTKYGSSAVTIKLPENYLHLLLCMCGVTAKIVYKCFGPGYIHTNPAKRYPSDIAGGTMNNAYLKPSIRRPYHQINDSAVGVTPSITMLYGLHPITHFELTTFSLDYLKKPEVVTLTVTQRDSILDTSDTLEFPEYVCSEILKRVVKLILENSSDPRLNTHVPINTSIQP